MSEEATQSSLPAAGFSIAATSRSPNEKKGLFDRIVTELNRDVPNVEATVERVSIEAIEKAGTVQSSFAEFNSLLSSSP